MTTLLNQQLQLHFGEEYAEVVSQAVKFCKTIMNKPWWGGNRQIILDNEGGMAGMRQQALMYVIEEQDISEGLKAYARYLRVEYSSEYTLTSVEDIDIPEIDESSEDDSTELDLTETRTVETRRPVETSLYSSYNSSDVPPKKSTELLESLNLSPSEKEFFNTYASVKDVRETAVLCGMTLEDGIKTWDRVYHRARRRVQSQ